MNPETDEKQGLLDEIRAMIREEVRTALCEGIPSAGLGEAPAGSLLSGEIRYFRLPDVLHMVALQGLTGRLSMSSEGKHVDIYFRSGDVAYATGDSRGEREQLGFLLVNMGKLTSGALEDALARCRESGERLGRVLVDGGTVSEQDIRSALMKQTERSAYKAMAWADGRFSFELCRLPEFVEDIPLGLKAADLVIEGVRRLGELRLFAEKIPRLDIVFTAPPYTADDVERMGLKPEERRVLQLIDGERDVSALIEASGLGELGLMRALYALYAVGIIRKSGPGGRADRTQYL